MTPKFADIEDVKDSLNCLPDYDTLVKFHQHTDSDEAEPGSVYSVLGLGRNNSSYRANLNRT